MKKALFVTFILFLLLASCAKNSNNPEFVAQYSGRYQYNSDEIIEAYFKEGILFLKWRGANNIKPMKTDDNTFFVKEMNEKIQFLTNPEDQKQYMVLVPKEEVENIVYNFRKLIDSEKVPNEYLKESNYEKALEGYLAIRAKDSLDPSLNESDFNSLGYQKLRRENIKDAISIFEINVALYPESPNVYDSLGEAFMKNGDTIEAINNYKKSLSLDSGNRRAKSRIKELEKMN